MKKIVIAALTIILLALGLCACTSDPTPSEPGETVKPTPKENLTVSDFTIVYPKKTLLSSAEPEEISRVLWNSVRNNGGKIDIFDDRIDEENGFSENMYEILIGGTNREQTAAASDRHLKYYDYVIKYIDTKLVINAGSDEALLNAVNYFTENYVNTKLASTVEGWKEIMQLDYEYIHDSNVGRLLIDGVDITEFTICSNIRRGHIDMFISQVLEKAGEKLKCPEFIINYEHEIIIGDCGKPEYEQVAAGLSGNDYAIEVVNGKLVIASASDAGLVHAMYEFYSRYLDKKCETLNISSENSYVYKRQYPITSMTLGGLDINDYVIVADENSSAVAEFLKKKIEEMTGISLRIVTDSPDNYEAAIVLYGMGNKAAASLMSRVSEDELFVKSEGSKIYIGTNSINYSNITAAKAFIKEILGYDVVKGAAASEIVDAMHIDFTANAKDYKEEFTVMHFNGIPEEFLINADGSVNPYHIEEAVEAGMNVLDLNGCSRDATIKVLEYCDKIGGVRCIVHDPKIMGVASCVREGQELYAGWTDDVKEAVNLYKGYSSTYMYHIIDEPEIADEEVLRTLRDIAVYVKELDPARTIYINNMPVIIPVSESPYENFLQVTGLDLLSYDRYVFDDRNGRENTPIAGYYDNLEFARNSALKCGANYMNIALLIDHYADVENGVVLRHLNENELRWQAFTSLAYGVSGYSYFTYWSVKYGDYPHVYNPEGGAISVDGKKTDHYYDIKNIDKHLRIMGDILMGRKSLAVFHLNLQGFIIPELNIERMMLGTKFEGYGSIEEIIAPDATIGFFEDNLMVIASKDFENSIDVDVKTGSKLLILDTETGEWNSLDSKSFSLEAGGAALIKIVE